jgi:hypothetical protein
METEYIRGKIQERDGALSRRPNARFDARGNDVWAERSGREFMPETNNMSGGSKDYSSPVTSGMGNISRLVGGRGRRRSVSDEGKRMAGGRHTRYRVMVGGNQLSLSPHEAQQLMMMDYRGGKHPYLTKTGRERKHIRGSGLWDSIKSIAGKVAHEFTDPESRLRAEYIPKAAEGLEKISNVADTVAPFIPGPYGAAAKAAAVALRTASKVAKGVNAANKVATAAQSLARGDYSKGIAQATDAYGAVKGSYDDYSKYQKEKNSKFPRPNLPSKPRAVNDSNGRPLAIKDREPTYWPQGSRQLALEDAERPLMLEDKPKTPKFKTNYGKYAPAGNNYLDLARVENLSGLGRGGNEMYGARQVPVFRDLSLMTPKPKGGRRPNARAAIVRKVMSEKGLSMIEASKYVKAHNLY